MLSCLSKYSSFQFCVQFYLGPEEQDNFYKQIYNDLSIIFEQSEQSVNFDERSLVPIKKSLASLYESKFQQNAAQDTIFSRTYHANLGKLMEYGVEITKNRENIDSNEADDTKALQIPENLYVKFIRDLQNMQN